MKQQADRKRPPLDAEALGRLALHYAGRYATTRSKLASYLQRKLRERGWTGEGSAEREIGRLVGRFEQLGYVNDEVFAAAKAASLGRRGYGERRIRQALRATGIEEEDAAGALQAAQEGAWAAAVRFAERKRLGPFARAVPDRDARQKAFAVMMRGGHPQDLARRLLDMAPGSPVDELEEKIA